MFEIAADVRRKLAKLPGIQVFLNPGGILRYLLNFGSSAPIDVEIRGFDLATGSQLAKEIDTNCPINSWGSRCASLAR